MGLGKAGVWQAPFCISFHAGPNAALLTLPNVTVFIADTDYELQEVQEVHETLGTDAGAVTLDVVKCTGTQTAAQGTTMLASTFNLKATINTVVTKTIGARTITTTAANRKLLVGGRIALKFGGVFTSLTGVCVQLWLKRLRRPSY